MVPVVMLHGPTGFFLLTWGHLKKEILMKPVMFLSGIACCHTVLQRLDIPKKGLKVNHCHSRFFKCKWTVLCCSSNSLAICSFPLFSLHLHAAWYSEWGWRDGLRYEWFRLSVKAMVSTGCLGFYPAAFLPHPIPTPTGAVIWLVLVVCVCLWLELCHG